MTRTIRVASGQGFWGDSLDAPRQQVDGGPIDYLMLDYLAEVTMSILQKQKERDPSMGYARDFIGAIESVLPGIVERGVKVIANAGGVNPVACAQALVAAIAKAGHGGRVKVGVVTGDDLLPRLDELIAAGHELKHMETGAPLSTVRNRVLSANAYIGSTHIVQALQQGAQIAPLPLRGTPVEAITRLRAVVQAVPGAEVVTQRDDYLYVRFTTRWMGFVDDAEFWADPATRAIQLRSASRLGRKDLGVNRARIERIRARLAALPAS
jgi:uncharacterized protein (DUF1499 family)